MEIWNRILNHMNRKRISRLISFDNDGDTSTGFVDINDTEKLPFEKWLDKIYRSPIADVRMEWVDNDNYEIPEIRVYVKPHKYPNIKGDWEHNVTVLGDETWVEGGYFEDFENEYEWLCDNVDELVDETIEEYDVGNDVRICDEIRSWFEDVVKVYKDIVRKYKIYNPS